MPPELLDNPLWQRYVASTWPAIETVLSRAPDSHAHAGDLDPDLLPSLVSELALMLTQSLRESGFDYQDGAAGCEFWIRRSDFPPAAT